MAAHGLLDYIDYRWHGRAHIGFVYVYISLISPEARQLKSELRQLTPDFSEDSLEKHYIELTSENKRVIAGYKDKVGPALQELHKEPWQTFESLTSIDTKNIRQSRKIMWEAARKARTKVIDCTISLNSGFASDNRALLPLFHVVATALLENIYIELNGRFSFYYQDQKNTYTNKVVCERDRYRVWGISQTTLEEIIDACKEKIAMAVASDLVGKIAVFLRASDPARKNARTNELDMYEICHILIGNKGWQDIATKTNIRTVLKNIRVDVKTGKDGGSFTPGELVEKVRD